MTIYGLYQKFMSAKMQNRVLLVGHDLGKGLLLLYQLILSLVDLLKTDFPEKQLPVDFGGQVPNENAEKMTKLIKKAAPQIEKDYAYLKQLCNQGGSYTKLDDNDQLSDEMKKLQLEIEQKQKEEESLATDL